MNTRNLAIIVGACCIAVGVVLFLLNVSGATDFTIEAGPVKGNIAKGTPGAVLAFIGLVIIVCAILKKEETTEIEFQSPDKKFKYVKKVRRIIRVEPAEAIKQISKNIAALEEMKQEIEKAKKEETQGG